MSDYQRKPSATAAIGAGSATYDFVPNASAYLNGAEVPGVAARIESVPRDRHREALAALVAALPTCCVCETATPQRIGIAFWYEVDPLGEEPPRYACSEHRHGGGGDVRVQWADALRDALAVLEAGR